MAGFIVHLYNLLLHLTNHYMTPYVFSYPSSSTAASKDSLSCISQSNSKSGLLCDWQFTFNQFILASSPLRLETRDLFFFKLCPCGNSPYVTSPPTRRWVCLLWICLAFRQGCASHIQHVIENSSLYTVYKSSGSIGFAKQIMPILRILCYNGSLVTWTV
jgi:hypothetical protein